MRIRTAKFVMIPMWILSHDQVRGNATRIATYAGLRAVAWEAPDQEWRSMREIARSVSDVVGLGEEAARKHLAELQRIGALHRLDDELIVPDDPPDLGTAVGTAVPTSGSEETQTGDDTLFLQREVDERTPVGTTGASSKADLNREPPEFEQFWKAYPRKKDRPAAIRAFNKALRAGVTLPQILEGLFIEIAGWRRSNRASSKIPYPATWLNSQGWANEPDRADTDRPSSMTERAARASDLERSEFELAVTEGRHEAAWRIMLQRAATNPTFAWWVEAERLHARSDTVIAATFDRPETAVMQWRAIREAALSGTWDVVSPYVGELQA